MSVSKRIIISDCLSTDRLIGTFDDDLILCPICLNIFWKPIACKTCENSFCLNCIRLWLNEKANQCPFNCHFQERKSPGILLKLLSKLKFTCENQSLGCDLILPYEGLEKHQCLYRIIQCSDCSEEMSFKDYQTHQEQSCQSKSFSCLKCSVNYLKKEGHTERQCLEQQIHTIQLKLDQSDQPFTTIRENFNKLTLLYSKLSIDEENSEQTDQSIPSAPPAEEEELRLSTVNFNSIRSSKREGEHIPNGYAGFNWENCYSMSEDYVKQRFQLKGFLKSFNNQIKCVAFNGKGNSLSIYLPNSSQKCDLHSFEAMSIYHEHFRMIITGYRTNLPIWNKKILLTNQNSQLYQIDFQQIDKMEFTPTGLDVFSLKPQTFALISLNFVL